MTRKTDSGNHAGSAKSAAAVKGLRDKIDKIDQSLVKLISERLQYAAQIGQYKNEAGEDVFAPAREEEVLQNVLTAGKAALPGDKAALGEATLRAVFREIISGSRAMQRVVRVAFLGPEYSYSHLATLERFGSSIELMQVGSISAVFEEVNRRHSDFGVVPLENSTDGRIADTLDMFIRLPQLKICSEVRLRIRHNLLANCEQMEIRRVYSKAQALSQCRNWLSKNVPQAALKDVSSTADAARLAATEPGAAALASRQAATRFGLRILAADIEDSPYNETRFAVIGPQDCAKTGQDKTAVMFKVQKSDQPGSLADALQIFKTNKVNLTWIETFPFQGAKSEYVFFVDFEGHVDDPKVKRTLSALEDLCERVTVLGSFPMAPLSDS